MKIVQIIFFIGSFYFIACKGKEKKESETAIEMPPIDFKSVGLIDVSQSQVMRDILCQTWEYEIDIADAKDADANPTSGIELVYRGFSFFTDGVFVKDPRGNVSMGKWNLNEKVKPIRITLNYDDGKMEDLELAYLSSWKLILADKREKDNQPTILIARAMRYIDLKKDPFYIDNILWKVQPKSMENRGALKKRLKDNIHFFVLFYDHQIHSQATDVSFVGLPSCYNWFAGGIILQKENLIQRPWMHCFYNDDQAMIAYRMADELIGKKYDWPKKEPNWMKLNVAVLKQMENRIDSIN